MTGGVEAGPDLIGRDAEVAAIRETLAADGTLVVTGEAGVGKTALVRAATAGTDRQRFEGGGLATLAWMPYLPLTRATHLDLAGDADWAAAQVERAVGPDVLFVDDLQWADAGTISVVERLVGRIAIVAAIRSDADEGQAVLESLLGAGARRLHLEPLSPETAVALARRAHPDVGAERARRIAAQAGGNPLLIEQLTGADPSPSLRLAVAARLRDVSPADRATLGLLVLADRPMPSDLVDAPVDRLVDRGFVVATPAGLTVRHTLLADAVEATLDEVDRRSIHARLAGLLPTPGERARHMLAAGDRERAHEAALAAVATATSPGERAAHLGLAAAAADGGDADRLRIDAAAALRTAGDLDGAVAALDAVVGTGPETLGRAEAIRARVCWSSGDPEGMRAAIERGLASIAGRGSVAEAMLRAEAVVVTALVDGHFEQGLEDASAAIVLAERSGADLIRPLLLRATILTGLGLPGWTEALERVMDAAREAGDPETELSAANNLVAGQEMHGDPEAGRSLAQSMALRAHDLRLTGWERQFEAMLTNLDLHAGNLEATVDRAETLLEDPLDPLAAQQVALADACALVDLGRFEAARDILDPLLATASDDVSGQGGVLHILAEAALWSGRPDEALQRVAAYARFDGSEYPTSYLVDVVAGWAAVDAEVPIPPRIAFMEPSGMLIGAAHERVGIEALVAGDLDAAATAFDEAAGAYVGYHRRGAVRARWAAAETRRRSGLTDEARVALESVEVDAAAQGFAPLLGRVRRSLRLLGVRRSTSGAASVAAGAGPRLTAREQEIVRLVAAGASNVEIARRLGLGRPTVARLLSSAMSRLGVDSRAQVAAQLEQV